MKTLCPAEPGELPPREGEDVWHGRDWGRRLRDQVNQHLVRVFGSVLLAEVISAGVQLSQIPSFGQGFTGPTAGNVLGAAVEQELDQTSTELIRRGMSIAPTIEIRPGYAFNVMVTQDLVFPGPYDDAVCP